MLCAFSNQHGSVPVKLRKKLCDYNFWYIYNDLPCFYSQSKTIEVEKVKLVSAVDVVRYSFIVHKSVTYLDLSVGEYGKREKLCYTKTAYKNNVLSRRYVLYKYHLDVSTKLDGNISELNASLYCYWSLSKCFYLKAISVEYERVYNMDVKPYIKTVIQKSNHKIRALMKFIKLLSIQKQNFHQNFIPYLELISEERGDSELVCQFLQIQPHLVSLSFFLHYNQRLVDFALYHTTNVKRRIFEDDDFVWKQYLCYGRYECFYQLIKYGYNYPFFPGDFLCCVKDILEHRIWADSFPTQQLSWNFFSSDRRQNIYILTVFFLLFNKVQTIEPIDLVNFFWQAIPDPFFTRVEINEGCDKLLISKESREKFIEHYECNITSGILQELTPRSLLHLLVKKYYLNTSFKWKRFWRQNFSLKELFKLKVFSNIACKPSIKF
ncbi:SOCS box domain-containing protein [Trichonephila clavata]|uniref:SOCS box domain-containing protein n=1 Tax=Trichonephila clavata TaxID=2740835 RepID=A0A8X6KYM4_TRICU|nr:SOCS box domain-containing protein [Trichonephila clavata]